MEDDDLLGGDGETAGGETADGGSAGSGAQKQAVAPLGVESACLSCGAVTIGVFCANCGQKHDDLRRSVFSLARDWIEDTFAFDSRMWRTLGLLAIAPGVVSTGYAHGRRSKYTPPIRLFLVVSFLFFLMLNFTNTLLVAIEIKPAKESAFAEVSDLDLDLDVDVDSGSFMLDLGTVEDDVAGDEAVADETAVEENGEPVDAETTDGRGIGGLSDKCRISARLRFLIKADTLSQADQERWLECSEAIEAAVFEEIEKGKSEDGAEAEVVPDEERAEALSTINRTFAGASRAVANPQAFNAAFNNWLPRVMFFMTPVLALIMGLFIRGRDALFFDHMVLSIYSHAVGFAAVGLAIFGAQAGIPHIGFAMSVAYFAYFALTVKRSYNRGWVKTIYSSVMVGAIYLLVLTILVSMIAIRIVMQG